MRTLTRYLLDFRPLVILALIAWLAGGLYIFSQLNIEAYPDPSPPLVEVITQNPAWSAEEMERQITVPVETTLFGIPRIQYIRSISVFGLSDVKLYFDYGSEYLWDRQEVVNRLQFATLPQAITPQLSPWSPIGEIYRFKLEGPEYSLNELKATQDWFVTRELKQVPGIIDITTFGGTTRQYQAEIDPRKLLQYNVSLPLVVNAVTASNSNVGGNYLTYGSQSVNIRGLGLLRNLDDMRNIVLTSRNGVPVFLRDVADVKEGYQPRLGIVGADAQDDVVEGIVLLQRGEQSLPALAALRAKVKLLNDGLLPHGMHIVTIYDRTDLIHVTTETVRHVVLMGLILVTTVLLVFLGDIRMSLVTALAIPCALLFAFALMVISGVSANLISIGAIDFGILVDAAIIVLERIYRRLQTIRPGEHIYDVIADATAAAARPVMFSVLVIIVALIPLFTMRGVPGKIFAPMSATYGYALAGALLFSLLIAPTLASFGARGPQKSADESPGDKRPKEKETFVVAWLRKHYARLLPRVLDRRRGVIAAAILVLAGAVVVMLFLGGEFMPQLEEGNLWVRAVLPQDVSLESASRLSNEIRAVLRGFPEVKQVVSQLGRPDDGTDVTTFNNIEYFVDLKPVGDWGGITKPELIRKMNDRLSRFPGIDFNFSQNIQDNVEEAMSGVKGENSLKLFGDDIDTLVAKADEIRDHMAKVRGVTDLGVFQETGQPQLTIAIDREASARYGLMASDVNAAVQAAVGGQAATEILEGDRHFDFVIRYKQEYRQNPEAIRNILLPTPDGGSVPLGQVAKVDLQSGAFMIYRENGRRYIPVKFSVRGRDLATTMAELENDLAQHVKLPEGYHYEWAGEYDALQKEQRRLAIVLPISLLIILALLFMTFQSFRDALLILATLPFGAIGGVLALAATGTPFSISAAVGFASVIGVATLGGVVMLSGIRRALSRSATNHGIERGALAEMRAVMMTCAAAGLGLLPAALSSGIGAQAQQPLARVVVGGMVTAPLAILFLLPAFVSFGRSRQAAASAPPTGAPEHA
ncbi:MAG: CusA/CzcA family heavy metal efflux RND transporter [Candidatus Acidiferrales bacterium]